MGTDSTTDGGTGTALVGTLKGVFLGSVFKIAGTAVLALALVVAVAVGAGVVGVPVVGGLENEFVGVNDTTTVIGSDLHVSNPNPIGAGFLGVSAEYEIGMNDVPMANGSSDDVEIGPGNSTIPLRTYLDNDRIPEWWVSHVERGERTDVRVNATVDSAFLGQSVPVRQHQTVRTDMLSSFNSTETRPINSSSPLVSDPLLYVNETRAQWGEVSAERTGIVVDFYIYNPKDYAIPVSKLNYTIAMNDVRVGAGENTDEKVLEPREVTRVRTVTYIQNENLDEWWVTHLEKNQVTDVVIDFGASVDVAGTSIAIPLDDATHRETIETDIFGSKDDTPPQNESSAAAGDGNGSAGGDSSTGENGSATTGGDGDGTTDSDDGTADSDDGTTDSDDGATTSGGDGTTTDDGGVLPSIPMVLAGLTPVAVAATAVAGREPDSP